MNAYSIFVGARSSPLSQAQFFEIQLELVKHHLKVALVPIWYQTIGDKDLETSLCFQEKTDFFTREIDMALLSDQCRIAIHSAKDLPEPLTKGLKLIALTKGVDPSDSLVIREGESFLNLPNGATICTSSIRREECVKSLRPDFTFRDIRGTIDQRLEKLNTGEADGVVIAEAALIRLKLTHLNRIKLPGTTTPLQGQLAIIAKEEDDEMEQIFRVLDVRG